MSTEPRIGAPPPPTELSFRQSLIYRLDPAIAADLPERWRPAPAGGGEGEGFARTVFAEIAAIETRINALWFQRVTGPDAQRPQLVVDTDDLTLAAEVTLEAGEDRPRVRVAIGAALGLDDLALYALSEGLFLAPDRATLGDLAEYGWALETDGARREAPARFIDYSAALTDHRIERDALTYAAPTAPWRLAQASLLSELMVAFVLLHERVHYAMGHLDYIGDEGAAVIGLRETRLGSHGDGPAPRPDLPWGALRVLEFQADTQAFFLLCAYALAKDGPCRRFEALLERDSVAAPPTALSKMDFGAGVRLSLTAVALTFLAFHLAQPEWRDDDPSHPAPHARLMNLMINTPIISPIVQLGEDGGFILANADTEDADGQPTADFATLVNDVFGMALVDFQLVAEALSADLAPLKPSADGVSDVAAWVSDLGAFWISDDEALNTKPVTEAGVELWSLRPVEAALDLKLRAFQIARFGQIMSVDVGGLRG